MQEKRALGRAGDKHHKVILAIAGPPLFTTYKLSKHQTYYISPLF